MLIMYANRINVFLCFMCVYYLHVSCVNLLYIQYKFMSVLKSEIYTNDFFLPKTFSR